MGKDVMTILILLVTLGITVRIWVKIERNVRNEMAYDISNITDEMRELIAETLSYQIMNVINRIFWIEKTRYVRLDNSDYEIVNIVYEYLLKCAKTENIVYYNIIAQNREYFFNLIIENIISLDLCDKYEDNIFYCSMK